MRELHILQLAPGTALCECWPLISCSTAWADCQCAWSADTLAWREMRCQLQPLCWKQQPRRPVSPASRAKTLFFGFFYTGDIYHIFIILPCHVANSSPPFSPCLLHSPSNPLSRLQVNMCDWAVHGWFLSLWSLSGCQRRNGMVLDAPLLSRLSHKRLMATFQVEAQRGEQDLYRCITLSPRGASISNFGELIVRGKLDLGTNDKYLLICKS